MRTVLRAFVLALRRVGLEQALVLLDVEAVVETVVVAVVRAVVRTVVRAVVVFLLEFDVNQ